MKLFDGFEAVRFPEENLIFITHNEYLYVFSQPLSKKLEGGFFSSKIILNNPGSVPEHRREVVM